MESWDEIGVNSLVKKFEDKNLSSECWHHRQHLVVAYWYLTAFPLPEAIEKLREGIQKFNNAKGVAQTPTGGYHDTLTIFFARSMESFLKNLNPQLSFSQKLERVLERFDNFKAVTGEYYSTALINSWEARTSWVPPDLKKLD